MRLGLVGPLPPPAGGMANQTRQLATLLPAEGIDVRLVRTNEPCRMRWMRGMRGAREVPRFASYIKDLASISREVDVLHVMANSGWNWHLRAAPAIAIGAARGVPVVVNYRGGLAKEFLAKSSAIVRATLQLASAVVVPSRFLQEVFSEHGVRAEIIPNIVDLETFRPAAQAPRRAVHIVVARNLERLYGIDVAIRATAILRNEFPELVVSIAGTGPERAALERLSAQLGLSSIVRFTGGLEVAAIAALYREAHVVLNPSRADNAPNALLEAAASGVPIVSTEVGGIPYLVEHGRSAWLVPPENPEALAAGVKLVLQDEMLREELRANGLALARSCSWNAVRPQWLEVYDRETRSRSARERDPALRAETERYTRFASGVLFPVQELLKGHNSVTLRKELERTQWMDPGEIERLQLARLKQFLIDAGTSVPYYRHVFEHSGFDPSDLSCIEDLELIPFLTKPLIRKNTPELRSERAGRLTRFNTGGSTGEPLVFYLGRDRLSHDVAAKWRATRWWGVDIGDREIVLWGSPIELGAQDRVRTLRDRLLRSRLLPAFEMSAPQMSEYLEAIRRLRPRMLFGYGSALARLARHARMTAFPLEHIAVRVVFTTGETLYPDQRRIIEEVFGAPVANGYGSRDAGFIAHECPAHALHISAEHLIVELVDERGTRVPPGVMGEVVVTHLATPNFPFIRYRTGDMAVLDPRACPCGRGLPVLQVVYGRSTDFIRTAAGGAMHALALIYEVRDRAGVQAFKFVQKEDFSIELQLVAGPELTRHAEQEILERLRRRVGEETRVRITRVEAIPPEQSGKHRYVVSHAR